MPAKTKAGRVRGQAGMPRDSLCRRDDSDEPEHVSQARPGIGKEYLRKRVTAPWQFLRYKEVELAGIKIEARCS